MTELTEDSIVLPDGTRERTAEIMRLRLGSMEDA